MNNAYVVALLAALAGFGGAWVYGQIQGASEEAPTAEMGGTEQLQEQIADLQREVRTLKNPPATLSATAPASLASSQQDRDALVEAVLAKVDERVDARVTEKLGDEASKKGDDGEGRRRARPRRKKMSLADAAAELELSGAQEDELRRVYDESLSRFVKLMAGPDGDADTVKGDLESIRKDPAKARTVLMKYLPNMMKNMGEVMTIATEREAAVVKAVGADNARRLNTEFDVAEANPMGRGFGGGGFGGRR